MKLREREMTYPQSCSWLTLKLETTLVRPFVHSSLHYHRYFKWNFPVFCFVLLTYLKGCNTLSSLFLHSSSSPALFLCYHSQEKFGNKLWWYSHLSLTSHSVFNTCSLPLFHPTSNPQKDSCHCLQWLHVAKSLSILCPHHIELSAVFNTKHFPSLNSVNHKLPIFLLPYRLFFLSLLFSLTPLMNLQMLKCPRASLHSFLNLHPYSRLSHPFLWI